ncbi:MAG: TRAP transporter fused permease subunit [Rhodobacteraceae bacterium]|nr:TRAP transporter fused permease subunit [Paracoccaceae bacterium]MBR9821037.1 TRAP transporter fused permease subunit [Paracoccaceae bacterium]
MELRATQPSRALMALATAFVIYQVIVVGQLAAMAGYFLPQQVHRAICLGVGLTAIYLLLAPARGADEPGWRFFTRRGLDLALWAGAMFSLGFVVLHQDRILDYSMFGFLDSFGVVLALLLCIPLMEAVRRRTGWTLVIIVSLLVLMVLFQNHMPGILFGQGYDLDRLAYSAYVGEAGVFGLPLSVASNILMIFLLFGALMEAGGAGDWFLRLALAATGRARGGPAKAAVMASAFFGSVSGSPSANTATTGAITIPMMKRVGHPARFAGAVEAVASTGGQILPPVMGAIAFVMADWLGISYGEVVIAAAVPALLYFLVLFVSVHLQAQKEDLVPLDRSEIPRMSEVLREGWFHLIPFSVLIYFLLVRGFPPGLSGVISLPFIIGASFLSQRAHWLTPRRLFEASAVAVRSWVTIVAITAFVGIMIGALELSGVGIKLSGFILDVANGNLILTMVMVAIACFVLGMGLDSIPVYVTLATLMAPALIKLGVPAIGAHLFVVYWGLASFFTPPLCVAVFVATSISGAKLWETGAEAVRLGIAVFIVPFAFVLNPGLLMIGSPERIALSVATALTGALLVAAGVRGWALGPLGPVGRLCAILAGLLLIGPGLYTALAGLALGGVALAMSRVGQRRRRSVAAG